MLLALGLAALLLAMQASPAHAQRGDRPPSARIVVDQGGVMEIVGQASRSPEDAVAVDDPVVLLADASGLVSGADAPSAQGLIGGRLTSDFTRSPFSYTVALPLAPRGAAVDLDYDDQEDAGVQVFKLIIGQNYVGAAEWSSTALESIWQSNQVDPQSGRLTAGTLLIYAPDDKQLFPSAAGADGQWFTADDPPVRMPAGYTLATINRGRVTFSRPRQGTIDALPRREPTADLSKEGYVGSFRSLLDYLADRYAWTSLRGVNWDALLSAYLPEVEAAAEAKSVGQFYLILVKLAHSIGDAHVTVSLDDPAALTLEDRTAIVDQLETPYQANVGIELAELEDGRLVVVRVADDSPAAQTGIVPGAQVVAVNGLSMAEALDAVQPPTFSGSEAADRLERVRYVLTFAPDAEVDLEYRLPGAEETQSSRLTAGSYPLPAAVPPSQRTLMPLSYGMAGRFGYVTWPAFTRPAATATLFADSLRQMNRRGAPGIVLDLRGNEGGSLQLAQVLAAFLFDAAAPLDLSGVERVAPDGAVGEPVREPFAPGSLSAPRPDAGYGGLVTVLVDPGCRGACEALADALQRAGRAAIVGQYATAGAGSEQSSVKLPKGITFHYPWAGWVVTGAMTPTVELAGVQPDVHVPVTVETEQAKQAGGDPVLDAAIGYLQEQWIAALQPITVTIKPFDVETVAPASWIEQGPGIFVSPDGQETLRITLARDAGDDPIAIAADFAEDLGGAPAPAGELLVGERSWALFDLTLAGQGSRLGVTTGPEEAYLVLLTGPVDQFDDLAEAVLQPALQAFRIEE